nr:GDP-L-galactose phosphorylase 2 [Tanacetum cinerariifolium]
MHQKAFKLSNQERLQYLSLLFEWEDRVKRGLFRYDVTARETKVIPGDYGFVAQLNERRHLKKRPTKFRVDKVLQPIDGKNSPNVVPMNVSPIEYGHVLLIPRILGCLPQTIENNQKAESLLLW